MLSLRGVLSLRGGPAHAFPAPSLALDPPPQAPCLLLPGLLHSLVPLAAVEPSGQAGWQRPLCRYKLSLHLVQKLWLKQASQCSILHSEGRTRWGSPAWNRHFPSSHPQCPALHAHPHGGRTWPGTEVATEGSREEGRTGSRGGGPSGHSSGLLEACVVS